MKRLSSYAYITAAGELHISIPDLLKAMHVRDTPQNREMYTQIAAEALVREYNLPITINKKATTPTKKDS